MPHLSPMNWILMILISWSFLTLLVSFNWWFQAPAFPHMYNKDTRHTNMFNWL